MVKGFLKWVLGCIGTGSAGFFFWVLNNVYKTRLAGTITGKHLDSIVNWFASPIVQWHNMIPNLTSKSVDDNDKWWFIGKAFIVEAIWVLGIAAVIIWIGATMYSRYSKKSLKFVNPDETGTIPNTNGYQLLALKEMAAAVALVDSPQKFGLASLRAVDRMLEVYEMGVAEIFGLMKNEYRLFWLIKDGSGYEFLGTHGYMHDYDKHSIQDALGHPVQRMYTKNIAGQFGELYDAKDFVFIRNEGEFRFALALFISKPGSVTDEAKERFRAETAMMMLLGLVDGFSQVVLKLKQESVGGGA